MILPSLRCAWIVLRPGARRWARSNGSRMRSVIRRLDTRWHLPICITATGTGPSARTSIPPGFESFRQRLTELGVQIVDRGRGDRDRPQVGQAQEDDDGPD